MRAVLAAEHGKQLYRKRIQMIEPVFAHTKHNRLINRFHRRGRIAGRTEWRLLLATPTLPDLPQAPPRPPRDRQLTLTRPDPARPHQSEPAAAPESCATASRRRTRGKC